MDRKRVAVHASSCWKMSQPQFLPQRHCKVGGSCWFGNLSELRQGAAGAWSRMKSAATPRGAAQIWAVPLAAWRPFRGMAPHGSLSGCLISALLFACKLARWAATCLVEGYEGPLCVACSEGYRSHSNRCVKCTAASDDTRRAAAGAFVMIAVVVVPVAGIFLWRSRQLAGNERVAGLT